MLKVTLVYSPNCGACKALKPAFDQLVRTYGNRVNFQKTTQGDVYAFPTIIFEKNGIEITRVVGNNPPEIEKNIKQYADEINVSQPISSNSRPKPLRPLYNRHVQKEKYKSLKHYN